ncbi:hypothetical protein PIB30_014785 [Stylosanthes scabra]|uniref:Uncharacterized protein n=1 Tax=Stylosanthes scabra TaxID=79078 RepID=A0ABU6Z747_9FABA|nr:hypothetical protein [Stylosanthes scabra]
MGMNDCARMLKRSGGTTYDVFERWNPDCRFTFLEDKRSNEHSMVLDVLRCVSLSHVHVYGELGMCAFRVT